MPADRPVLFDREALIASLEGDERFQALCEAALEAEEEQAAAITRMLLMSKKPVDQRVVDFTRGYIACRRQWLGQGRIDIAKQRLAMQAAQDTEEDEA